MLDKVKRWRQKKKQKRMQKERAKREKDLQAIRQILEEME